LYQKLLESDSYCWNYRWWLGGILFWDTVYMAIELWAKPCVSSDDWNVRVRYLWNVHKYGTRISFCVFYFKLFDVRPLSRNI